MTKRIIVALSGTPFTESAIRHAVELAQRHEAELTGVTDVDLGRLANVGPIPMGAGTAATDLVEHRLQLTQEHIDETILGFETACRDAGIPHNVVRESGDPYDTLIALWRYHDLVVAGLRGLFEYGVIHNPDDMIERLINRGVRPILAAAPKYRPVHRVLVAYNGSMEAAKSLKRFVQSRLWPRIELEIACFDLPEKEARQLLTDAADYCKAHGYTAHQRRIEGDPEDRLLPYAAESNADLIVMGSSSRARILKHLLGDTVLHAIRKADTPLFLAQ